MAALEESILFLSVIKTSYALLVGLMRSGFKLKTMVINNLLVVKNLVDNMNNVRRDETSRMITSVIYDSRSPSTLLINAFL